MTARPDRPTKDDLNAIASSCVGFRLRRVSRLVTGIYDDALRPSGLKSTQYHQLVALSLHQIVTVKELARSLAVDRTSLTRSLEPLTREGLVASAAGEDGRERLLRLTDLGSAKVREATPLWNQAQTAVSKLIGADTAKNLIGALKSVESVLSEA